MEEKVLILEDYYKLLELQKQYEEETINEDDMTLEQINDLIKLYKSQISRMGNNVKTRLLYQKIGDNKWEKKFTII